MRVVIFTAGRNWTDRDKVFSALQEQWDLSDDGTMLIRHGNARGGDQFAEEFYQLHKHEGVMRRKYPAPWDTYGKVAGRIRNARMVSDGGDVCVGAPDPDSKGTHHCMTIADMQGIPVVKVSYAA
jgi:hypothetical protein